MRKLLGTKELFVAAAAGLLLASPFASAQTEQSTAEVSSEAAASDALDLSALTAGLRATTEKIENLQTIIESGMQNAAEAEARFDELILAYQELSDLVGTNGVVVASIDAFIVQYHGYAADAAASNDPAVRAYAPVLEALAAKAGEIRASFITKAALAETQIAQLGRERNLIIVRYRANQGGLVVEAFQTQLNALTAATVDIQTALDKGRAEGVPIVTGPAEQ